MPKTLYYSIVILVLYPKVTRKKGLEMNSIKKLHLPYRGLTATALLNLRTAAACIVQISFKLKCATKRSHKDASSMLYSYSYIHSALHTNSSLEQSKVVYVYE